MAFPLPMATCSATVRLLPPGEARSRAAIRRAGMFHSSRGEELVIPKPAMGSRQSAISAAFSV